MTAKTQAGDSLRSLAAFSTAVVLAVVVAAAVETTAPDNLTKTQDLDFAHTDEFDQDFGGSSDLPDSPYQKRFVDPVAAVVVDCLIDVFDCLVAQRKMVGYIADLIEKRDGLTSQKEVGCYCMRHLITLNYQQKRG